MSSRENHRKRSHRSNHASNAGMNYMDWNSHLKNDRRKKVKDIRKQQGDR